MYFSYPYIGGDYYKQVNKEKIYMGSFNYRVYENIDLFPWGKVKESAKDYLQDKFSLTKNTRFVYNHIITADTETCIVEQDNQKYGFITDISITIEKIGTYYCHTPKEFTNFINRFLHTILNEYSDDEKWRLKFIIYFHNFQYDYVFLRNFILDIEQYSTIKYLDKNKALAVKSHRYVNLKMGDIDGYHYEKKSGRKIHVNNQLIEFRDSVILVQKKLEKFVDDEQIDTGGWKDLWDYNKIRSPHSERTYNEKIYANADTIFLCEALRSFITKHNRTLANIELTSTGIIRTEVRKRMCGKKDIKSYTGIKDKWTLTNWRNDGFLNMKLSYSQNALAVLAFHGGYTHANPYIIGEILEDLHSYDFGSSYPSVMFYEKFPMSKFRRVSCAEYTIEDIKKYQDKYAFLGVVEFTNLRLKKSKVMASISYSKAFKVIGCNIHSEDYDNGRVMKAKKLRIAFTEQDLLLWLENYNFKSCRICYLQIAEKEYLPNTFRDYLQELYYNKCTLKGVDSVNYAISKTHINAMFGMCAMMVLREIYKENFSTGEWEHELQTQEDYEKYFNSSTKFLPYQWALWITAYAQRNLFRLGSCFELWVYSDTDSVKGKNPDKQKIERYNNEIRRKSELTGYGTVKTDKKTFTIGLAEDETEDFIISEFITLGAKKYCYRQSEYNKDGTINYDVLHMTLAGVPKIAVKQLKDDITNFQKGTVFYSKYFEIENYKGSNKLSPKYFINSDIKQIKVLGEIVQVGSFIELIPCDYLLDQTARFDIDEDIIENDELW